MNDHNRTGVRPVKLTEVGQNCIAVPDVFVTGIASPQLSSSESHALPERFHDSSATHVPADILYISQISKILLRASPRLFRRHSMPDVLFRPQIDVKLPLFRGLSMSFLAMP
jgi:hypothetical protein